MLTAALILAAAPAQAAVMLAAASDAEPAKPKLICRRETPIGSLIATRKVCLTADQWEKRSADGNAAARKMVQDNMGTLNDFNN